MGKVIVIVNMEGEVSTVPSGSKCLFVNMPMTMSGDDFNAVLNDRLDVIKKGASNSTTAIDSDISIYNTHAQTTKNQTDAYTGSGQNGDRGYVPSKGQRITEIDNILDWSKKNYNTTNYGHDKWIYLGIGGYYPFGNAAGSLCEWTTDICPATDFSGEGTLLLPAEADAAPRIEPNRSARNTEYGFRIVYP